MTTRVGLRVQLCSEDGIEVVDVAETMQEGIEKCQRLQPHVVLLDLHLPDSSGPRTLITAFQPLARVLVFSAENRQSIVQKINEMGCGFVSKSESTKMLVQAIRDTAEGKTVATRSAPVPAASTPQRATPVNLPNPATKYEDPYIGTIVDEKYQVTTLLGVGGYSNVYRANDMQQRRSVALKILHSHLAQKADTAARFNLEAKAAIQIVHPNVAKVYETGCTENGQPFIAMEYISGRSLEIILEETPTLPYRRIVYIMRQVCAGLQAAHDKGMVHRDVKPGNIYLGSNDLVKLLDFGLAKSVQGAGKADFSLTATGTVLGTPSYMAPEQCQGLPIDPRSDLYSVGCVMHELITGRHLFTGDTLYDVMTQHVGSEPDFTYLKQSPAPPRLQSAVIKLLQKHPSNRFRTARELTYELSLIDEKNEPEQRFQILKF